MQCLFVLANQLSQERVLKLQQEVAAAEQPKSRLCWGDVRPICMEGRPLWSNCTWTANHQAHSDMVECCMKHCWSRTLGGRNCRIAATDGYRAAPIGRGRSTYNAPFCATISKLMASLKPIGQSTFVLPAENVLICSSPL